MIVLAAIEELGFEPFLAAVVLGGVIQIGLGLIRAGVLGYFFPSSVIKGMLAGIGLIIVLKQIPHAFGYDDDPEGELGFVQADGENTFSALGSMLDAIDGNALLVASISLLILLTWDRFITKNIAALRLVQGPLVAVAFGIGYEWFTRGYAPSWALSQDHLVSVPVATSFSEFVSFFKTPAWSAFADPTIWITAVTLAIVASLETLLCVEATDKLDPLKRVTPTNRELLAQGVGNTMSGFIGGLPITQVIVRSSANIQSGGRTKTSAIMHGVLMLIFVALLPGILNLIPLAVLAAILIVVGCKLAKPSLFAAMWKLGPTQFIPFAVTVAGLIFTDLLSGIALGLGVAVFVILQRSYSNSSYRQQLETGDAERGWIHLRLAEEVTFLNRGPILEALGEVPDGAHLTLDASRCVNLDHDVKETIQEFLTTIERRGITVEQIGDLEGGNVEQSPPPPPVAGTGASHRPKVHDIG